MSTNLPSKHNPSHLSDPALSVSGLSVEIASESGIFEAVKKLALAINHGQTFALVGESGCGKSMTALALLRLLPEAAQLVSGEVVLANSNLVDLPELAMRKVRGGQLAMIFQEPGNSLNPVIPIGDQILESIVQHTAYRGKKAQERAVYWLERVGIHNAAQRLRDYPFQFSGGQKQRIMIAIALAAEPRILIADEPTTALDVTVQAQILDLLADIQQEMGLAILLITHDLAVVQAVADYVALMRHGEIVETAPAKQFFAAPDHPYAQQLLAAIPSYERRGYSLTETQAVLLPAAASETVTETQPVLKVENLSVAYQGHSRLFRREHPIPVVRSVSFELFRGETLALLGESGCGKTTTAKALLQLLDKQAKVSGSAWLDSEPLLQARGQSLHRMRRDIQIVFQDPYASLNPRMPIGEILDEGLHSLRPEMPRAQREERMRSLLERVELPSNTLSRYPHEFSGGQRQRIAIARALAVEPRVLICDEPTSALDVSVQAQILELLQALQAEFGTAYLFITHNFGVVEYLADRIAIMHNGEIIELGSTEQVLHRPAHEQTRRLLDAVPRLREE